MKMSPAGIHRHAPGVVKLGSGGLAAVAAVTLGTVRRRPW